VRGICGGSFGSGYFDKGIGGKMRKALLIAAMLLVGSAVFGQRWMEDTADVGGVKLTYILANDVDSLMYGVMITWFEGRWPDFKVVYEVDDNPNLSPNVKAMMRKHGVIYSATYLERSLIVNRYEISDGTYGYVELKRNN
jgi:hypothetical protein